MGNNGEDEVRIILSKMGPLVQICDFTRLGMGREIRSRYGSIWFLVIIFFMELCEGEGWLRAFRFAGVRERMRFANVVP